MTGIAGTPMAVTAAALPKAWPRLEFNEHRFVAEATDHTDGVVISLRFESQLKPATLTSRIPFLIDLETWRLPFISGRADETFKRDTATVVAQAVPIPITAEDLGDDESMQQLVRAGMTAQVGAEITFAPDFQFRSLEDPWLAINLRAVEMTRALAGTRPIGAWIHVTLETMLS